MKLMYAVLQTFYYSDAFYCLSSHILFVNIVMQAQCTYYNTFQNKGKETDEFFSF